jgi:hypothetical protein
VTWLRSLLRPSTRVGRLRLAVLAVALLATAAKVYLAWTTFGSNDVGYFSLFADGIRQFGPVEIYGKKLASLPYNHPPLSGWLLVGINLLTDHTGFALPFLIKLPAIVADLISSLLLFELIRRARAADEPVVGKAAAAGEAAAAGIALALSPVLLVISGFHGNTDPVFVMLALLSLYFLIGRAAPIGGWSAAFAGVAYAASLSIKIVPVVLLPLLLLIAWRAGRPRLAAFLAGSGLFMAALWGPVVALNWVPFRQNVLEYGGIDRRQWGIVEFAHRLDIPGPWVGALVGPGRFVVVVVSALLPLLLAWYRPAATTKAAGLTLVVFLLISTASATQYLAWAAAAAFLVSFWAGLFYNVTAGAFLISAYDRWNGGVMLWHWSAANVTNWTSREVRSATVVWLTLSAVAIVGALPTRAKARAPVAGAQSNRPPGTPGRADDLMDAPATVNRSSLAPQEDDARVRGSRIHRPVRLRW